MSDRTLEKTSVHLKIKGRVQGVWFRGWTAQQAKALGIQGWVRNRIDKSVEAVFVGPLEKVNEIVARCRKGPPLARVDSIDVSDLEHQEYLGFEKRPTV